MGLDTAMRISIAHGMLAEAEIEALAVIVSTLPENPVAVVLGSGPGTASITMLSTRPDIKVISIDVDDAQTERQHAKNLNCLSRLEQIRDNSHYMVWDNPQQIDLLFVDACHAYSCVKADNMYWLPFLKEGGVVWFHDYGTEDGMWAQVKQAVDEDIVGKEQLVRVNCSIAFRWE